LTAVKALREPEAHRIGRPATGVTPMFLYLVLGAAALFAATVNFVFIEDAIRFRR
jgi:hypothetical protein